MKHNKSLLLLFTFLCLWTICAEAQPSWVKNASKSVFTLKTFAADGSLKASSSGIFVSEQGEALSNFAPFHDAARAVVIDAAGKEYAVDCIIGANEPYDVAKFRVDLKGKKVQPLTLATQPLAVGATAWLLPYRETKQVSQCTISRVETFNGDYAFYTLPMTLPSHAVSAPLLNGQGQVVGLMRQPATATDAECYAVSALYADSLHTTGLSINDPVLRSTHIRKALPAQQDQAVLTLYVGSSSLDSAAFSQLVSDFIAQFPAASDGYVYRAQLQWDANDFSGVDQSMEQAISMADKKDDAHYNYARLIYQKEIYKSQIDYAPWSLDKALQEACAAYDINNLPLYRHQQALILFSMTRYQEADAIYAELNQGPLRSADLFYETSRCKEMMRDTTAQLAMLDSALATFERPYLREAASYLLVRAQVRMDAGQYRDAVSDLNEYETLLRSQLNDRFYYLRHQADVGGRLFQQALDDIDRAISFSPTTALYYAEKASLQVRVRLYDEAVETAQALIAMAPDDSDGYLFLGLAQCLKQQTEQGLQNLQRAKELGDPQAEGLIEKYSH